MHDQHTKTHVLFYILASILDLGGCWAIPGTPLAASRATPNRLAWPGGHANGKPEPPLAARMLEKPLPHYLFWPF